MPEVSFRDLKQVPLFAELSRDDLKAIAELVKRTEYPAGRVICRQGQLGLTAYFVDSGELRVLHVDPQGIEHEVARIGPGGYFGETSLLLGEPLDATIETVQDTSLLYLNKEAFDRLLQERPSVRKRLQIRPDVARKLRAPRFKWQDPDEIVIVSLHKHNMILYRQLVFPVLLLLVGLVGLGYWIQHRGAILALIGGVILLLSSIPFSLYLILDHWNDNYVLTNKRVVYDERVLLLRESRAEAPLRTVQDVQESQQGLLAQLFNFGDLIIETAGERGHVIFRQIPNPEGTRNAIFEQIHRTQAWARAEERDAIRGALRRRFGIQPSEEQAAAPVQPSKKRRFKLTVPAWIRAPLRVLTFFVPPLRYEQGDTITWRKHWIALVKPIWLPTLLVVVSTAVAAYFALRSRVNLAPVLIGYGTLMVFLFPWWLWRFDDWQNDIYQVTATRIIDVERLPFYLREDRREASLDRIQNTRLEIPGVLGKVLNYGSVTIETAGAEPFTFDCVKDPREVQAEISRRVEAFQQRQRQEEAERRRAELLDWFSVYDQIRSSRPPATQPSPPPQQEP